MNPIAILVVAALLVLPAIGLLIWARRAMAQVEAEMTSFANFDGLHFDI